MVCNPTEQRFHGISPYQPNAAKPRCGKLASLYGVTVAWLFDEPDAPAPTDPLSSRVAELPEEYRAVVEAMVDLERKGRKPAWGR